MIKQHAKLIYGSKLDSPIQTALQEAKQYLCLNNNEDVLMQNNCDCKSCHLLNHSNHPDLYHLSSEENGQIKIDDVRQIQSNLYQSPIIKSGVKVIIVNDAANLNMASANAMLKILEEPPPSVYWLLVTTQINLVPITILSRCIKQIVTQPKYFENYLHLEMHYPIFEHKETIIKHIAYFHQNVISINELVEDFKNYDSLDVWMFLRQCYGQLLKEKLLKLDSNLSGLLAEFYSIFVINLILRDIDALTLKTRVQSTLNQGLLLSSFFLQIKEYYDRNN